MAFRIEKPAINLRSKLTELDFNTLPYQKVNPGGIIQQKYYYSDTTGGSEDETTSTSFQSTVYFRAFFTPREPDSMILINWMGRWRVRKFGTTGMRLRTIRQDSDYTQSITLSDGDPEWYVSANSSESQSTFPLGYWYGHFNFVSYDDRHTTRQYKYEMQHAATHSGGSSRVGENSAHGHINCIITEVKQ